MRRKKIAKEAEEISTKNKSAQVHVDDEDEQDKDNEEELVAAFLRNRRQATTGSKTKETPVNRKATRPPSTDNNSHKNFTNDRSNRRFCHFWNNFRKCTFKNCIFAHEKSPVCKFDGHCNRKKCMFSHVKQNGSFLAGSRSSQPPRTVWPRMSPSPRTTGPPSPRVAAPSAPTRSAQYWGQPRPAPWASWTNPWMVSASGPMGMNTNYQLRKIVIDEVGGKNETGKNII